jgi:hypothetical protein
VSTTQARGASRGPVSLLVGLGRSDRRRGVVPQVDRTAPGWTPTSMVPQTSSAGTHCDRTPKHEREPPQRRALEQRALIALGLRTVQADRPSGIQLIEVDSTLGSPFVTSAPRCRRSRNLRIACVRSRRTPAYMDSPAPKRAAAAASARTTVTHGAASRPIPSETCADRAGRSTRPQKRPRVPRTLAGSSRRPRSHRIGAHRHK